MPHFPEADEAASMSPTMSSRETDEAREARLQVKDRRRRYLELNPEYFQNEALELADPLLYDRMIRKFQTTAERETEGRQKGYSGTLEADIMRSEAKMEALAHPDPNSPLVYQRDVRGSIIAVDQNEEDRPKTKEEGAKKWREVMEQRFLRGEDKDFDYGTIDDNEKYNDWDEETRRTQEAYFDDEEEEQVGEVIQGETGVQDY